MSVVQIISSNKDSRDLVKEREREKKKQAKTVDTIEMINVAFCKRTKAIHCWQRDQFMETKATFIYIEMFIAYEHHF